MQGFLQRTATIGDEEMTRTVTFTNGVQLDIKPFDLVSPYEELGMRTVGTDERGLCFLRRPKHQHVSTRSPRTQRLWQRHRSISQRDRARAGR